MKKEYDTVLDSFYNWIHQTYTLPVEILVKQNITFNFGRTLYTYTDCEQPTLCDSIDVEADDLSMVILTDVVRGQKFFLINDDDVHEVKKEDIKKFKMKLNDMMGIMENISERNIDYLSNGVFDYYS